MTTPLIIPIFLPNLGCRQRCIFCNQKAVAAEVLSPSHVRELIEASMNQFPLEKVRERQVAFYGGSFTAIPKEDQIAYLKELRPFLSSDAIDSIRVSTRPDALDEEILSLLKEYGVRTVEVGAQSMMDDVLFLSHRGHCQGDTLSAVSRLKRWEFEVGIHLMIGLPGDSLDHFLKTLDTVIDLKPDFLRIHPTLVLDGAPLEALWREGNYSPLTLEASIRWLKRGILKLEKASIPIARIGLQPTRDLEACYLAGPYHPSLHQLIDSEIFFDMAMHLLETHQNESEPLFICHPGEVSNVRGQKNSNLQRLRDRFGLKAILMQGEKNIPRRSLTLRTATGEISVQRKDLSWQDNG
ncbi:MAG TPA: radical SAM protein [Thermodesulfobacteriota bacterium]|nr:radical SAM protein [Thermodesulfobacteriota bacterium]